MKMNRVIDGFVRFIDANIYPTMNDWQKAIAADVVGRMISKAEAIGTVLTENAFVRALGYADSEGNIDIEGIFAKLKEYVSSKGKLEIKLPLMPSYKFYPEDIDSLYRTIIGG